MNILKQTSSIMQNRIDLLICGIKQAEFPDFLLPLLYLFLVYPISINLRNKLCLGKRKKPTATPIVLILKNSVTDRIIRSSNSLLKSLKSVFPDSSNSDTCTSHGYKLHHSVHLAKKSSLPEESFESSTESSQTNWQSEKKIKKLCCYDRYQLSEVFNLFKNAIDAKLHLFRSGNVGFSFFFFYLIHNSISDLAFVLIHLPHHRHHQQHYKNQRKRHKRWFVPKWKESKGTYSWFHAFSGDFSPLAFHRLTL